jgi:hypothetical protein
MSSLSVCSKIVNVFFFDQSEIFECFTAELKEFSFPWPLEVNISNKMISLVFILIAVLIWLVYRKIKPYSKLMRKKNHRSILGVFSDILNMKYGITGL